MLKIIHTSSKPQLKCRLAGKSYEIFLNQVSSGKLSHKGIYAFKQVSLSPRNPDVWVEDPISFIAASARLSVVFKILDDVHRKAEKAIIFLESRAFQEPLSRVIKERYLLKQHPLIINGSIAGAARQERVNEFKI